MLFRSSKVNEIFNQLMKEGLIKLPNGVTLPSYEESKGKSYCKWHNTWSHSTNNCLAFFDRIQDQIKRGKLKFPNKNDKAMGIDNDPFPEVDELKSNSALSTFAKELKNCLLEKKTSV